MLISSAPYLPFLDRHKGRAPGLFALDPADWVEADAAFAAQMAYRAALTESSASGGLQQRSGAGPAVAELVRMLVDHLVAEHGYRRTGAEVIRRDGVAVRRDEGVATLALLAQEDWLLLSPPADRAGEYTLQAGAVLFPAGWALPDKLGRPLTEVHAPVPGYAEDLAARVNRVFAALRVDGPLQRLNHSIAGTPELHCPTPRGQHDRTGGALYLRVERQTLRRLPETRWIAFSVKTYLTPLSAIDRAARAALADAYAEMHPERARYRAASAFADHEIRGD